jgi:hypothetical protein
MYQRNGAANGTPASQSGDPYSQYLVNGNGADSPSKQQKRAGKEWLPYSGQRQLIIAIDLGELSVDGGYPSLIKAADLRLPTQALHIAELAIAS